MLTLTFVCSPQNVFEAATRAAMLVRPTGAGAHEKAGGGSQKRNHGQHGRKGSSAGGGSGSGGSNGKGKGNDAGGCQCVVL